MNMWTILGVWGSSIAASLLLFACEGDQPDASSSSHWIACRRDIDCAIVPGPEPVSCEEGYCVDSTGMRIPASVVEPLEGGASSGGASSGGASSGGASSGGASNGGASSGGASSGGASSGGASSGGASSGGTANGGSATGGMATGGAATGGSGGAGACASYARPMLDKDCVTSDDCFVGWHAADCCGSAVALSFASAEEAAFTAHEETCPEPMCECPGQPPRAEDGAEVEDASSVAAECVSGQCIARSLENVGQCLDNGQCIDPDTAGTCLEASGILCRGDAGLCVFCE